MSALIALASLLREPPYGLGLILLAVAIYMLLRAGAADRKDWIIERATPLPIKLANPRDDIWVTGELFCADPLSVPGFGQLCVYYDYWEEERAISMRGERWHRSVLYHDQAAFSIVQGNAGIGIAIGEPEFDHLQRCGPVFEGRDRRRYARYLPYPGWASALGCVSEDRARLERYGNIPLIVTLGSRIEFLQFRASSRRWMRRLGGLLLLLGVFAFLFGLSLKLDYPATVFGETPWPNIGVSAVLALAAFAAWWFAYTYNRLVLRRERCKTAWRHVDVDLKNRYDLVPELMTVIKGYAEHERELQELLAQLRTSDWGVGTGDSESPAPGSQPVTAALSLSAVWAVVERYPRLLADGLFARLQEQLTALEDKIAFGRKFYNDSATAYLNLRRKFPSGIVAALIRRFPIFEFFEEE